MKVATPRAENKGPLRVLKSQETHSPLIVVPTKVSAQKDLKVKQRHGKQILNGLKLSNLNNLQIASNFAGINLSPNRNFIKSPNYKIYKSRRFGSSASSSRSSLFRRYEERKRQRINYPAQINYLIRSFHTSKLEPIYARYLMPARNQHVEARLGSIPDAVKFSSDIQSDLLPVDSFIRSSLYIDGKPSKNLSISQSKAKCKQEQVSFSLQNKFKELKLKDSPIKIVKQAYEKGQRKNHFSPEQREYVSHTLGGIPQIKHSKPSNELFIALHDRTRTELHEKHKRNRMLKLGLIKASPHSTEPVIESNNCSTSTTQKVSGKHNPHNIQKFVPKEQIVVKDASAKNYLESTPILSSLKSSSTEANELMATKLSIPPQNCLVSEAKKPKTLKASSIPSPSIPTTPRKINVSRAPLTASMKRVVPTSSGPSNIATIMSQMTENNYRAYRYNRADFFSTKKY